MTLMTRFLVILFSRQINEYRNRIDALRTMLLTLDKGLFSLSRTRDTEGLLRGARGVLENMRGLNVYVMDSKIISVVDNLVRDIASTRKQWWFVMLQERLEVDRRLEPQE